MPVWGAVPRGDEAQLPLSVEDVSDLLGATCAMPSAVPTVGAEVEWLVRDSADIEARPTVNFLQGLLSDIPLPAGSRLSFEPGGQLELSSVPARTPDEVVVALRADVGVVRTALRSCGLRLSPQACDSDRPPRRVNDRRRYEAMETWFRAGGWVTAAQMMCNTASVQVNIGCGADPGATWRRAHALVPVLAAAFASSPGNEWASSRLQAWAGLDSSRTSAALSTGDPVPDWVSYVLAAKALAWRDAEGEVRPAERTFTMAEWIQGAPTAPRPPTTADLELHVSTLFPPVRLKGWIEIRVIDMVPDEWWPVPIAVTSALLGGTVDGPVDGAAWLDPVSAFTWEEAGRAGLRSPALAQAASSAFLVAEAVLEDHRSDLTQLVSEYRARFIDPHVESRLSPSVVRI